MFLNPLVIHCHIHMEIVNSGKCTLSPNGAIHILALGQYSFLIFLYFLKHSHSQSPCFRNEHNLVLRPFSLLSAHSVPLPSFICSWHSALSKYPYILIHPVGKGCSSKWMCIMDRACFRSMAESKLSPDKARRHGKAFLWSKYKCLWMIGQCAITIKHSFLFWDDYNPRPLPSKDL